MFITTKINKFLPGESEIKTKSGRIFPAFSHTDATKDSGKKAAPIEMRFSITENKRMEETLCG